MTQEAAEQPEAPRQAPMVKGVKLRKCPACKNIVGTETWCCPRCGIDFRGRWRKKLLMWLIVLGVGGFFAWKYWLKDLPVAQKIFVHLKIGSF